MRILKLLLPITGGSFLTLYLLMSNGFLQIEDDEKSQNYSINDRSNTYRNSSKEHIKSLSSSEIEQIKVLTFFLGHSRSGHSIIGTLLDAHPHMVVANEGRLFIKLQEDLTSKTPHFTSKSAILNPLWKKSVYSYRHGSRSNAKKGYILSIDGLYQGMFVPPI